MPCGRCSQARPSRCARLSSRRPPLGALISHNQQAKRQRRSSCNNNPRTRPTHPSLRRPARAAEAAGFAGGCPLWHGSPPAPTLGRAPVSPCPQKGWCMTPGQGPLNARCRRELGCPKTLWKWIPLQRANSPRPILPSELPWPTPNRRIAGPRPPRPRNTPGLQPPQHRKAPRTSRP